MCRRHKNTGRESQKDIFIYQRKGGGLILINQFNLSHFSACSKPGPGFKTSYVVVFYMFNDMR